MASKRAAERGEEDGLGWEGLVPSRAERESQRDTMPPAAPVVAREAAMEAAKEIASRPSHMPPEAPLSRMKAAFDLDCIEIAAIITRHLATPATPTDISQPYPYPPCAICGHLGMVTTVWVCTHHDLARLAAATTSPEQPTGGFTCECCQRNMEVRINGQFCNECAGFRSSSRPSEDRVRLLLAQIIHDLPTRRDWLDPVIEREARALIGSTATTSLPSETAVGGEAESKARIEDEESRDIAAKLALVEQRFNKATTHDKVAALVWAGRALIDADAEEAPFFTMEYQDKTLVYTAVLGWYFEHAKRVLGREPYPAEVDQIETGFCNPWLEAKKPERMEKGRQLLNEIVSAAPVPDAVDDEGEGEGRLFSGEADELEELFDDAKTNPVFRKRIMKVISAAVIDEEPHPGYDCGGTCVIHAAALRSGGKS